MTEEKIITAFDTIIQRKDKIDTAAMVDLALTELLMAIKDLNKYRYSIVSIDQNRLIKYGEFLINLADKFDFSKEKYDRKREIISNSSLPNKSTPLDPEEFQEKVDICTHKLKIFEYRLVYFSPLEWLQLGGTFEEWLEKSFTKYGYFALFLKLAKIISDYFDLLYGKFNITIPKEDRIHCPKGYILHSTLMVRHINQPLILINNNEVNCSMEEYHNKVTSLLNYGVRLDCNPNSITETRRLTEKMFGINSDSANQYLQI